ncbi:MAG TPA: ATP-binding protein [Candidatus Sulfotelmatobacter sp.]|jgi:signal transduction histidine kinase/CheY-like chemotaxis protein|nr:ATP-binding protein [Candidatus Sulfotelmatobacter sp.]
MSQEEENQQNQREGALLSWIHQFAPYGVVILDRTFLIRSWNQWMASHSMLSSDDVLGRDLREIYPELEERKLIAPFQRALLGESSVLSTALHQYLLRLKSPMSTDESNWMRQTARVAPLLAEGQVCGIILVIEDVTQREIQAETLSRQHRRDEILSWALIHLLKSEEPRKTSRQLFFKIAEVMDFESFFLYLREGDSDPIRLYTAGGISDELQNQFLEFEPFTKVPNDQPSVIIHRIKNRPEPEFALLKEAKISSAVVIPLRLHHKQLGSLCFASWSREFIADDEASLLITIAQYLATAVDKENTNRELRVARERADSANRAKDEFLASLSHELRTPLNPVLLIASDASENPALTPEVKADFKTIRTNIELEARLIDDLLDITRITHGKLLLHPRLVDLKIILEEIIRTFQPEVNEKKITLQFAFNSPKKFVHGDDVRLQQIFWNVLKNAIKFTPEKGRITMAVNQTGTRLQVSVSDTGIGLTKEETEQIFEAFSQGDHTKNVTRRFGGLGLGLAIARKLVELHHGRISASSEGTDKGSTFTIELPLAEPETANLSLPPATPQKAAGVVGAKARTILLVEDHEATRVALSNLLVRRGYNVIIAGTAREAREASVNAKIDLVISDIGLPDESGHDLMKHLGTTLGLKGIALTGYGMEEDIARCLASGFATHLIKPVNIHSLETAVALTLNVAS